MRLIVLAVVTLAACASAVEVLSPGGYHMNVGVPLAAKIKQAEEKMIAEQASTLDGDRIIGGVLAPANAHPFFAGLLIDLSNWPGQSVCGSTLLTATRLITAAHCWTDGNLQAWRFNVILGTQQLFWGGQRIQSTQVVMHSQYQTWDLRNDVAMIYLPFAATLSGSVQPAVLPTSESWNNFAGEIANAVGFGRTSDLQGAASTILSHVDLPVLSNQQCLSIVPNWVSFVTTGTICTSGAGGIGVCSGDSGGPLVLRRSGQPVLIGVSSFAASNACEQGWPSGFARVTSFLPFINQHLR